MYLAAVLIDPLGLHVLSVSVADPCVVRHGQQAGPLQALCHGVTVVPGEAVHDARVTCGTDRAEVSAEREGGREVERLCVVVRTRVVGQPYAGSAS